MNSQDRIGRPELKAPSPPDGRPVVSCRPVQAPRKPSRTRLLRPGAFLRPIVGAIVAVVVVAIAQLLVDLVEHQPDHPGAQPGAALPAPSPRPCGWSGRRAPPPGRRRRRSPFAAVRRSPSSGGASRTTRSYSEAASSSNSVRPRPTRSAARREGGPAGRISRPSRSSDAALRASRQGISPMQRRWTGRPRSAD